MVRPMYHGQPDITTSRCWYDAAAENMGRGRMSHIHKGDPIAGNVWLPLRPWKSV